MLKAPPVPQMDPGARGFRVDLGELIAASKPTKIDAKGFIVEGLGGAALGEGMQKAGGAIDKMAQEMARSVNNRRVMDAENQMIEGSQVIAENVANEPDDTKWVKIASDGTDQFQKKLITKDLSPDAAEAINQRWLRWKSQTVRETMQAAFSRSRESEATELAVRAQKFAEAGQVDAGKAVTEEAVGRGLISKGTAAKQNAAVEKIAKEFNEKKQIEQVRIDAAAAPEMWLERNKEPPDTDNYVEYAAWRAGQAAAREVVGLKTKNATDDVANAMAGPDGAKLTNEDIKKIADGRLSDAALKEAYKDLAKVQNETWKKQNLSEAGVAKNYADLLQEVKEFKGKRGDPKADEEYARLARQITILLPAALRDEASEPLNRKYTGEGGPTTPQPLKQFVDDRLDDWYKDEKVFGPTKKLVPVEKGDAGYEEYLKVQTKFKKVDDPPRRDAAKSRLGGAKIWMHNFMKEHPEAGKEEIEKEMWRAVSETAVPEEVQKLMGALEFPAGPVKVPDWNRIKESTTPAPAPAPAPAPEPKGVEEPISSKPAKKKNPKAEAEERRVRLREAASGLPVLPAGESNLDTQPTLIPFEE